ncbi:hypothetical protein K8R32_01715 [bacterium]|nr:hypothetical protein [bacterium]
MKQYQSWASAHPGRGKKPCFSGGFTIIEIFIVVGITALLIPFVTPIYGRWHNDVRLDTATLEITRQLRAVQAKSFAGVNDKAHGMYFNGSEVIIFQGTSYATRDSEYDLSADIPSNIAITLTNSMNEMVFNKNTGLPSATSTLIILNSATGETKEILVNILGLIENK